MIPDLALTLWQPWASLICPGPHTESIKTIETRSWETKYRGPVLICSAARPVAHDLDWLGSYAITRDPDARQAAGRGGDSENGPVVMDAAGGVFPLPLGAALGVATIVDCLPTQDPEHMLPEPGMAHLSQDRQGEHLRHWKGISRWDGGCGWEFEDVTNQLPYGDFNPGRYGWLLDDIVSFAEPIPVRGAQQLWRTDHQRNPNLRRQIAEALA